MALAPVLPKPETLPAELMPTTMEAKISGAIIHFTPFKNIFRKGVMYSAQPGKKCPIKNPEIRAIKIQLVSFMLLNLVHMPLLCPKPLKYLLKKC